MIGNKADRSCRLGLPAALDTEAKENDRRDAMGFVVEARHDSGKHYGSGERMLRIEACAGGAW